MALHGTMEPWNGTMEVSPSRRNTLWELYVQKENICWWFCLISSCICFFLALELNFETKNSNKAPNKGKLIIKNKQPLKKVRMTFYFSFLKLRGRFFMCLGSNCFIFHGNGNLMRFLWILGVVRWLFYGFIYWNGKSWNENLLIVDLYEIFR